MVLVVPQGPYNAPDSFGGNLEDPDGFKRFMGDVVETLRHKSALKKKDFGNWGNTLLNITDKDQYSAEYLCSLGAVESLLTLVESEWKENPNSSILNSVVDILFNISKYET